MGLHSQTRALRKNRTENLPRTKRGEEARELLYPLAYIQRPRSIPWRHAHPTLR